MLLNQKVERRSTVPGRVTNLGDQKKNGGRAGGYVWNPRLTGCLRSPMSNNDSQQETWKPNKYKTTKNLNCIGRKAWDIPPGQEPSQPKCWQLVEEHGNGWREGA